MVPEALILKLTSKTPSGGSCRIGEACFKVWYCADIWEWEYQGETYFDALDLAEAMDRAGVADPRPVTTRVPNPRAKQMRVSMRHPLVPAAKGTDAAMA